MEFACCFSHEETENIGLDKEDHRGKMPISSNPFSMVTINTVNTTSLLMLVVVTWLETAFARILHYEIILSVL